jgi:hypothetical protein
MFICFWGYIMNIRTKDVLDDIKCRYPRFYPYWERLLAGEETRRAGVTSNGYFYIEDSGRHASLTGITNTIKCTFVPGAMNVHTAMERIYKNKVKARELQPLPRKISAKQSVLGNAKARPQKGRGYGWRWGMVRGSLAHAQISDYVTQTSEQFAEAHEKTMPEVQSALHLIGKHPRELTIRASESIIYDPAPTLEQPGHIRVGTQVDMICSDAKGHIVILEFKVGSLGYFDIEHPSRYFASPFTKSLGLALKISVLNLARIQVWVSMVIIHKNYGIPYECMRGLVVNLQGTYARSYPVSIRMALHHGERIYKAILEARRKGKIVSKQWKPSTSSRETPRT